MSVRTMNFSIAELLHMHVRHTQTLGKRLREELQQRVGSDIEIVDVSCGTGSLIVAYEKKETQPTVATHELAHKIAERAVALTDERNKKHHAGTFAMVDTSDLAAAIEELMPKPKLPEPLALTVSDAEKQQLGGVWVNDVKVNVPAHASLLVTTSALYACDRVEIGSCLIKAKTEPTNGRLVFRD